MTDQLRALTTETQEIWDQKAEFWDERMGEGNAFQRALVGPATERLLAIQPGEVVADSCCGNGVFARRLATLGATVVAADFSLDGLEEPAFTLDPARTGRLHWDTLQGIPPVLAARLRPAPR